MTCSKCGRTLKHATPHGMGPKCARAAYGVRPEQRKRAPRPQDERQERLFPEVQP